MRRARGTGRGYPESLEDSVSFAAPDIFAQEIADHLRSTLDPHTNRRRLR